MICSLVPQHQTASLVERICERLLVTYNTSRWSSAVIPMNTQMMGAEKRYIPQSPVRQQTTLPNLGSFSKRAERLFRSRQALNRRHRRQTPSQGSLPCLDIVVDMLQSIGTSATQSGWLKRQIQALLWMDEIHFAPPEKPWNELIPCKYQPIMVFAWFQRGAGFGPSTVILSGS